MTYIIVTQKQTVIGSPYTSYFNAMKEAARIYGDDAEDWIRFNVRVEENRT